MRKISQREARRNLKRLTALEGELEGQRRRWASEYLGGVQIAATAWDSASASVPTSIRTARALGHAVVAIGDDSGTVRFVALPHPKVF